MKITNDYYDHKIGKAWTHEFHTTYVTDDAGATWEIKSSEHGLIVRAIGAPGEGNDSIRIQPICSNEIQLRAVPHEDP